MKKIEMLFEAAANGMTCMAKDGYIAPIARIFLDGGESVIYPIDMDKREKSQMEIAKIAKKLESKMVICLMMGKSEKGESVVAVMSTTEETYMTIIMYEKIEGDKLRFFEPEFYTNKDGGVEWAFFGTDNIGIAEPKAENVKKNEEPFFFSPPSFYNN